MADTSFFRVSRLKRAVKDLSVEQRGESTDVKDSLTLLSDLISKGPKGGYTVSEVGQRSRRIKLEQLEQYISDLKKRSDALYRADQSSEVRTGLFTPSQFIAYNDRIKQLRQTPKQSAHEKNIELYGLTGAAGVEREEDLKAKQDALQHAKHQKDIRRANTLWTGVTMSPVGFNFNDMNIKPWTDWQKKVFNFASAHGLGTGKSGLANAEFYLKKIAEDKGEKQIAQHHADLNYQRHLIDMTPRERERHDLIMKYGGGAEGIALADYEISKTREEKAESLRRRRRLDEAREEQDLRLSMPMSMKITHKLLKKIGINTGDSAKDLRKFAKQQKAIENIPIVGKYLASSPVGAGLAVAGAVIKTISTFTEQADNSNAKYVDWANAQGMYGYAGERFSKAAYAAGIKDPGAIAKLYGMLTMQYGDAETALDMFGSMFAGMSSKEKSIVSQSLGFTPETVAMMDLMAGNVKINENRRINAQKNMADVGAVLASTSDQSLLNKTMVMFGSTSVAARMGDVDFSNVAMARKIAIGDMLSSMFQTLTPTNNVNVSVNVDSVNANNPEEFAEKTVGEGSDWFRAVIESLDWRCR